MHNDETNTACTKARNLALEEILSRSLISSVQKQLTDAKKAAKLSYESLVHSKACKLEDYKEKKEEYKVLSELVKSLKKSLWRAYSTRYKILEKM